MFECRWGVVCWGSAAEDLARGTVDYEELFVLGADVCITFEIRFKKLLLLTSTHCSAHYNVVRRNTACRIFLPAIFSYNIPSFRL